MADPQDSDYHGNVEQPAVRLSKRYQVEVEKNGCEHCGEGKLWVIVANGIAGGTAYANEEEAVELCDQLNDAFEAGRASEENPYVPVEEAMRAASAMREKFTLSDPPDEEPRKQFCLSCGATHYKEICPECGSDAQDNL